MMNDFAAFILSHGRPDKVKTYKTLRDCGYTGKIYIIIDNTDKKIDEYKKYFKDEVIVFNKKEIQKKFDSADNFFEDMRCIIYARNASFEIAQKLGIKYFIQLDDDYVYFNFRFNNIFEYCETPIRNLDHIFSYILNFYKKTNILSIAMSQNGDFIGGDESSLAKKITLKRKCMNSFFCSTERPFKFVGRINEDVNSYTYYATIGKIFFTTNQVSLKQVQTQKSSGGMTELYLDSGTYIKSFYSVIFCPSSVKISNLNNRIHHKVLGKFTYPKILSESLKK